MVACDPAAVVHQVAELFGPSITRTRVCSEEGMQRRGVRGPELLSAQELLAKLTPAQLVARLAARYGLERVATALDRTAEELEFWARGASFPTWEEYEALEGLLVCSWCSAEADRLEGSDAVCGGCSQYPAAKGAPAPPRAPRTQNRSLCNEVRAAVLKHGSAVAFETARARVKAGWPLDEAASTPLLGAGGWRRRRVADGSKK